MVDDLMRAWEPQQSTELLPMLSGLPSLHVNAQAAMKQCVNIDYSDIKEFQIYVDGSDHATTSDGEDGQPAWAFIVIAKTWADEQAVMDAYGDQLASLQLSLKRNSFTAEQAAVFWAIIWRIQWKGTILQSTPTTFFFDQLAAGYAAHGSMQLHPSVQTRMLCHSCFVEWPCSWNNFQIQATSM
jgi:hypothetical protein